MKKKISLCILGLVILSGLLILGFKFLLSNKYKKNDNILVIGPDGLGELKLGMQWQKNNAVDRLVRFSGNPATFDGCIEGKLLAANGANTEPFAGVYLSKKLGIVSISTFKNVHTPDGIGIGSTVADVKKAYPDFEKTLVNGEAQYRDPTLSVPGNPKAHYEISFIKNKVNSFQIVLNGEDCFN